MYCKFEKESSFFNFCQFWKERNKKLNATISNPAPLAAQTPPSLTQSPSHLMVPVSSQCVLSLWWIIPRMPNTTTNELSLLPFFSECTTWTTPTFHLSHHFDHGNKIYQEQEFLFLVSGETSIFCVPICLINYEVFHRGTYRRSNPL